MKRVVSILALDKEDALDQLNKALKYDIDLVELRVDYLNNLSYEEVEDLIQVIRRISDIKIILTLRTYGELGKYKGNNYYDLLKNFLNLPIDYMDIEQNSLGHDGLSLLSDFCRDRGILTILSVHRPKEALSLRDLYDFCQRADRFSPAIIKIVDEDANEKFILDKLLYLNKIKAGFPTREILYISMGEIGQLTRIRSNLYDPPISFISVDKGGVLGQIALEELEEKLEEKKSLICYTSFKTSLGQIYIYSDFKAIIRVSFEYYDYEDINSFCFNYEDEILVEAKRQILDYLDRKREKFDLPIKIEGSDFERSIYENLQDLAYGQRISYKDLAKLGGHERAWRAVGRAMANNRLPIIVPCHRVVNTSGSIGNYLGGAWKKERLLDLEKGVKMLKVGDKAPVFALENQDGKMISLEDYLGKTVILYFYPKDNTPGCSNQACGFRDINEELNEQNAIVLGVSRDKLGSHQKFIDKYGLNFNLLSDPDKKVHDLYGVMVEKNMFGKKAMGVSRDTFVIDEEGIIKAIFKKVKAKDNPLEVLDFLRANKG